MKVGVVIVLVEGLMAVGERDKKLDLHTARYDRITVAEEERVCTTFFFGVMPSSSAEILFSVFFFKYSRLRRSSASNSTK